MEFTEIWLRGTAPPVNAEHKRAHKRRGVFNKHLIVFNIEQMIVITGILHVNAATVNREKVGATAAAGASAARSRLLLHKLGVQRWVRTSGGSGINLWP